MYSLSLFIKIMKLYWIKVLISFRKKLFLTSFFTDYKLLNSSAFAKHLLLWIIVSCSSHIIIISFQTKYFQGKYGNFGLLLGLVWSLSDSHTGIRCGTAWQDPVLQTWSILGYTGKGQFCPFLLKIQNPVFKIQLFYRQLYNFSLHTCFFSAFSFFFVPTGFKGKDSPLTLDWDRVRVFDRDVGQMFVNMAKTAKEAKVCICIAVVMIV